MKMGVCDQRASGKEILISSHTYRYLEQEDAARILFAQRERGADIAKLVTAAECGEELQSNMELSAKAAREFHFSHLFLCGGAYCKRHRRLAPFLNNGLFLCVVEYDDLATPVQPLLGDARQLMDLML